MSIKIDKLKPGMIVYDVHSYKMGNTTISSVGVWDVEILEVDLGRVTVLASWNGNRPETYHARAGKFSWRAKRPVLVVGIFGSHRIATRAEVKAMKEAKP